MKQFFLIYFYFIASSASVLAETEPTGQPGQVSRFAWSDFPRSSSIDLLRAEQWVTQEPSRSDFLPFESIPSNWGNGFGQVFRGYLRAPISGDYQFFLSADEEAKLYLGTSSDKFSSVNLISTMNSGSFGSTEFGALREQASSLVRLEAGQRYYFELHHKEATGTDFVKLAWSYCGGGALVNWAESPAASASQSSTAYGGAASRAIDGNTDGRYRSGTITHTWYEANPSWQVDLGEDRMIDRVEIFNRSRDGAYISARLRNYRISILNSDGQVLISTIRHDEAGSHTRAAELWEIPGVIGRVVKIEILESGQLALAEVRVFGRQDTTKPCPPLDNVPCAALQNWSWDPAAVATQSSTIQDAHASRAIDGNESGYARSGSITHTHYENSPFWQVDLGSIRHIDRIEIFNRSLDQPIDLISARLSNYRISIIDDLGNLVSSTERHTSGESHTKAVEFWETGGVNGQVVRVERLPGSPGFLSLSEVKVLGRSDPDKADAIYQPMALVPSDVFESFAGASDDLDDDELRDSWELLHGFDSASSQNGSFGTVADPDGDGFTNFQESLANTDPFAVSSVDGHLMVETWYDIDGYSLSELYNSESFYRAPDKREPIADSEVIGARPFSGTRIRGYLTAPVSGTYYFWISARDSAELWLSSDVTKYRKQKLASLAVELGTGHGVNRHSDNRFDFFSSQMSNAVELVAGEKYFYEVIGKYGHSPDPHYSVAWAVPGDEGRSILPVGVLSSYSGESADGDDDYLPDGWEVAHGLDEFDNGLIDREGQGERGDLDLDGLSNREEFLAGTDPTNPDSDGDGLSDLEELRNYRTDPLESDISPENFVQSIPPNSVAGLGENWSETAEGVLLLSFRGEGRWQVTVPSDGFYILQVEAAIRGNIRSQETVPIHSSINGTRFDSSTITFGNGQDASIRVTTPYLRAGTHEFSLNIDNYIARRSLEILALRLLEPGGLDINQNNLSDEVEERISLRSGLSSGEDFSFSYFSPAFVEGKSSSLDFVDLTKINRTSQTADSKRVPLFQWDRMLPRFKRRLLNYEGRLLTQLRAGNNRMEGTEFLAASGAGRNAFYTFVELQRNEAIGYVAIFEDLGVSESRTIIWTPKNVLEGGVIHIPVGSELLLGAWIENWDRENVSLSINGSSLTFPASQTHVERFDSPGTFSISASHPSGQVGTITVHVRDAFIPGGMAISENRVQNVYFPGVSSDLKVDGGGDIEVLSQVADSMNQGSLVRLATKAPGKTRIAARLNEGQNEILHVNEVEVIGISDSLRNDSDIVTPIGDGLVKVASPLLVTPLPEGVTVEITIFAGGVTFSDGTTFKRLTAADFDENGIYQLEFIMPFELLRAPCHYIRMYDAQGTEIYTGS